LKTLAILFAFLGLLLEFTLNQKKFIMINYALILKTIKMKKLMDENLDLDFKVN
jgi:hypothetical protein